MQKRVEAAAPKPSVSTVAGQQLFEKAVKAYRQDDYREALELFDRYLTDNPGSPMAADASLYKAECYLKLSAQ
jgi:TolA-binding protein